MAYRRRQPGFYALTVLHVGCFALLQWGLGRDLLARGSTEGSRLLFWLKVGLEVAASFYFFAALLKSWDYLVRRERPASPGGDRVDAGSAPRPLLPVAEAPPAARVEAWPPVACIYLCASDLDRRALESLCRLDYPGRYHVYVHDDSTRPAARAEVDEAVEGIAVETGRPVFVLRRKERQGGKPGALNHVLARIGHRYPFALLADSDSTAVDRETLTKALPLLRDPRVAAVQFRNVGVAAEREAAVNGLLRRAIEVFDLFACHQARHGLPLFFGHNAIVRTAAVEDVGRFREGVFADDVDLSIRLARRGWRIEYAPAIPFGETHPPSYAAFRRRAYKWAFGCGQVLREHLPSVLRDRSLTLRQKAGLMEFIGFYAIQAVLIAYLTLVGMVMPLLSSTGAGPAPALFLSGLLVVASIFLPSFAYFARRRRLSEWWPFALVSAMVYGSVAFTSARGLIDGVLGRRRIWVPTNLEMGARHLLPAVALESLFGLLLFLVPAIFAPASLWQPSLYLFAGVFLFTPCAALLYAPAPSGAPRAVVPAGAAPAGSSGSSRPAGAGSLIPSAWRRLPLAGLRGVWILLAALGAIGLALSTIRPSHSAAEGSPRVTIRGDRILVDGEPFLAQGIHYSPWLPGTGPMKQYHWPADDLVTRDLRMIRDLGANTIIVHDAPASILPQARRFQLMVIYAYYINWQSIGDDTAFERRAREIVESAREIGRERNLLAILLGNEVVEWVLRQEGPALIEGRLRSLAERVRRAAPGMPISHANWPIGRQLDLSFMDLACFNLYPSWPREVVVAGYGNYIDGVLKPIAAGRPLLITEFGQNSLEVTEDRQAQILRDTWKEIRGRTSGGAVFSFADEWWKNYDNPISADDFWHRQYAPDDEKTHDLDPEEYYGIVTSERAPKPAYAAVRDMFSPPRPRALRTAFYAVPLLLLFGYTLYVFARCREA